jgi:hypothetical protein
MANDRVYFIPWDRTTGSTLSSRCDEYNNANKGLTHHQRNWTPVFNDDAHPNGTIESMGGGSGNRLVVAGHGAVNDPNIYASEAGASPLSYSDIADRLEAHGLKKYYFGTIGCDVCHSAEGANPFAKRLAKELRNRGYKMICVMGYKGSLYSGYSSQTDARLGGQHKYRHRTVQLADGSFEKTKDASERFYGF